jgi:putative hydrolase of the HAD superfamily
MIKAVLFDLDDTLILDDAVSHEAYLAAAQLAAPLGADVGRLAREALEIARRRWLEGPYYAYCNRIGHSATEGLWARYEYGEHPTIAALRAWAPAYREAVWRDALATQGIANTDLPARQTAHFMEARRRYPLYPEIPALLDHLRGRGYKLGIVTNGVPDLQREKLNGSGIAHLFDAAVVSGEIDCGKPDPGIFIHICRQLGVAPFDCVMAGDNPERDVAGAMAAGLKSVWVQRNGRAPDPRYPGDLTCTTLSALLPWIEEA